MLETMHGSCSLPVFHMILTVILLSLLNKKRVHWPYAVRDLPKTELSIKTKTLHRNKTIASAFKMPMSRSLGSIGIYVVSL